MNDTTEKLLIAAVIGLGGYYLIKKAADAIAAKIPPVVKEGAQATALLAEQAFHNVTDPLDAFGISPASAVNGTPYWQATTPQENPQDVVSNNDLGINYNYF